MGFKRFVADVSEMQRNLTELLAENTAEEEAASLEIAQSASRFSRRTRKVVDDKLSFSATLMRAGEVTAATRLLAEVEEEVRDEEIALIETVNEVKVAQAVRRGRITRLRLARSLAVAMLGACILAFSAVGMAVAGVFKESERNVAIAPLKVDGRRSQAGAAGKTLSPSAQRVLQRLQLQIGDVKLVLTKSEFQRLTALTGGDVDEAGLTDVLGLLHGTLHDKVSEAIAVASDVVDTAGSGAAIDQTPVLKKVTRAKRKAARAANQQPAPADQQSSDEEKPTPEEEEPEPSPSPSEGDSNEGNEEEGATILGDDDDGLGEI